MIRRAIVFTEYWFRPDIGGTDHLEGNQWSIDNAIGKGVVHFHNKRGGIMRLMFIGDMSLTRKANILLMVEQECNLKFVGQEEVEYMPQFENNLKSIYGEKLVIK